MTATVVSYVPSPHRGYVTLFRKYPRGILYILGSDFIQEFKSLIRNLPANDPADVCSMVRSLGIFSEVRILDRSAIEGLSKERIIVMPDEDVSRELAHTYFPSTPVHFEAIWLRWHKDAALQGRHPDANKEVSFHALDREIMGRASSLASRSSDWWRQVGAVAVQDGKILFGAYNKHHPSEHSPYLHGDPRSHFEPGKSIDVTSALHAEVGIIARAAREGISMKGAHLYVTTFPCPPCALAVANAGFAKVFYLDGYSLVAGDDVLRSAGVEIIRVVLPP